MKVTEFKTKKINMLTGGKIGTFQLPGYPKNTDSDGGLINSFLSNKGVYIGSYKRGWWYVKHKMKVCEDYPLGVAERWDDDYKEIFGYYGYTHRGGQTFRIGDRLFDETYVPVAEDYDKDIWKAWETCFNKNLEDADEFDKEMIYDSIASIIPYSMRGKKTIENLQDAKQAAINLSKYLS